MALAGSLGRWFAVPIGGFKKTINPRGNGTNDPFSYWIQSKKKEGLPRPSEVRRIPVPQGQKGLLCIDLNFFVGTNTIHRSALDPWTQPQHIRLRTVAPELSSTVQDLQALTGLAP